MWDSLWRHLTATFDLLLPPACLLCGNNLDAPDELSLCTTCAEALPPLAAGRCSCCADAFVSTTSVHLCGRCLKKPPHFTKVYASCRFQGAAKTMIHNFKYRNQVSLAKPLGALLKRTLEHELTDYQADQIIPVPLHLKRLRKRSYNQAMELARPIAKSLQLPINTQTLLRQRQTQQQFGLTADERRMNLKNAFRSTACVSGKNILLIDDVMTSSETARACSQTLIQAGAREVRVAVVARA